MFSKIEEYCSGKVYSYGGLPSVDIPSSILISKRIECMKPQISKEMQEVHARLLTKWNYELAVK